MTRKERLYISRDPVIRSTNEEIIIIRLSSFLETFVLEVQRDTQTHGQKTSNKKDYGENPHAVLKVWCRVIWKDVRSEKWAALSDHAKESKTCSSTI